MSPRSLVFAALAAGALAAVSCGGDDPSPASCQAFDATCAPLVPPTSFGPLYDNVVGPSCAAGRTGCHSAAGRAGNLDLSTADVAFAGLRERAQGTDVACTELWTRVAPTAPPSFRMPPGTSLSPAQSCAIGQWIGAGMPR